MIVAMGKPVSRTFDNVPCPAPTPAQIPWTVPTDGTPGPTPTPTPVPTGCAATIETVNAWGRGFQSTVTVRAGNSAINGWTVTWSWPGSQSITQLWGGVRSGTAPSVS